MSDPKGPPPLPQYTGPGSPQDVPPPKEGASPIDPATLPKPIRDELEAPDPVAIDTASAQGWRRPLLMWLGVAQQRAQAAGNAAEAARLQRRIDLVAP